MFEEKDKNNKELIKKLYEKERCFLSHLNKDYFDELFGTLKKYNSDLLFDKNFCKELLQISKNCFCYYYYNFINIVDRMDIFISLLKIMGPDVDYGDRDFIQTKDNEYFDFEKTFKVFVNDDVWGEFFICEVLKETPYFYKDILEYLDYYFYDNEKLLFKILKYSPNLIQIMEHFIRENEIYLDCAIENGADHLGYLWERNNINVFCSSVGKVKDKKQMMAILLNLSYPLSSKELELINKNNVLNTDDILLLERKFNYLSRRCLDETKETNLLINSFAIDGKDIGVLRDIIYPYGYDYTYPLKKDEKIIHTFPSHIFTEKFLDQIIENGIKINALIVSKFPISILVKENFLNKVFNNGYSLKDFYNNFDISYDYETFIFTNKKSKTEDIEVFKMFKFNFFTDEKYSQFLKKAILNSLSEDNFNFSFLEDILKIITNNEILKYDEDLFLKIIFKFNENEMPLNQLLMIYFYLEDINKSNKEILMEMVKRMVPVTTYNFYEIKNKYDFEVFVQNTTYFLKDYYKFLNKVLIENESSNLLYLFGRNVRRMYKMNKGI